MANIVKETQLLIPRGAFAQIERKTGYTHNTVKNAILNNSVGKKACIVRSLFKEKYKIK